MAMCACGADLPDESETGRLCPLCLLRLGFGSQPASPQPAEDPGLPRILTPIGRGPQATVYLGYRSVRLPRFVALKVLDVPLDPDVFLASIRGTMERLGRASLTGVAAPLDCGTTADGLVFLMSPYLPGPSLAQVATRQGGVAERLAVLADVSSTVAELHRRGIAHGALKPTNVLVSATRGVPIAILLDTAVSPSVAAARNALSWRRQSPASFEELRTADIASLQRLVSGLLADRVRVRPNDVTERLLGPPDRYSTASEIAFDLAALRL